MIDSIITRERDSGGMDRRAGGGRNQVVSLLFQIGVFLSERC